VNIDLKHLAKHKDEMQSHSTVYIMCRRGNASKEATQICLDELGMTNVKNVEGGIEAISD